MRSAYCIRREIGECLLEGSRLDGDLFLVRGAKRYRLAFRRKTIRKFSSWWKKPSGT